MALFAIWHPVSSKWCVLEQNFLDIPVLVINALLKMTTFGFLPVKPDVQNLPLPVQPEVNRKLPFLNKALKTKIGTCKRFFPKMLRWYDTACQIFKNAIFQMAISRKPFVQIG
jgi:hypothetical protein